MEAGRLFGIPVRGTHAHAFVSSFMSADEIKDRSLLKADGTRCDDFVALVQDKLAEMKVRSPPPGCVCSACWVVGPSPSLCSLNCSWWSPSCARLCRRCSTSCPVSLGGASRNLVFSFRSVTSSPVCLTNPPVPVQRTPALAGSFGETNASELAAFVSYAQAFPQSFLALVDTYDVRITK